MKPTVFKTAATVAALAALGGGVLAVNASASNHALQLGRRVAGLERQLAADRQQVTGLQSQLAQFTQPSDPLSAYNDVCDQPMTDNQNDLTQTYYFPCTNSAQTIPQPGN